MNTQNIFLRHHLLLAGRHKVAALTKDNPDRSDWLHEPRQVLSAQEPPRASQVL